MAFPGGLLLLIYAVLNGMPFFYPDAFVYFYYGESAWHRLSSVLPDFWSAPRVSPEGLEPLEGLSGGNTASAETDGKDTWTPSAGRSIYYGLLSALPGIFSPPWNGVILQAYCSALAVALAWRTVVGAIGLSYLAVMAALGLFSTFGIFASTMMPDVWAANGILVAAVLVAAQGQINRIDGAVLWSIVLFAALAHSSHLAVIAILTVVFALARIVKLVRIPWSTIGKLVTILVTTIVLGIGARMAIERAAGNPPLGLPFLTAHLVDGGPGMDLIRAACPEVGFAVCAQSDQLPAEWREFIFNIATPTDYRRQLVEEDAVFALATLRHDPSGVIRLALRDAARQMVMIDLVSTPIRSAVGERAAVENVPTLLAEKVRTGRLYEAGWLYRYLSMINTCLVLVGVFVLVLLAIQSDLRTRSDGLGRLLAVSALGLILNAIICGVLASPYDRFQARVAWLVPVLALIALFAHARDLRSCLQEKKTISPWPL